MYRGSEGISTRRDNPNTLISQSAATNDAPRDPLLTALLHWTLPVLWTRYVYHYVYGYAYGPVHLRRRHDHCKNCTAASRARPELDKVSGVGTIIGIHSSMPAAVSNWIRLPIPDLIRLNCFSIWLDSIVVSIWLDSIVFLFLFDSTHV